MPPIAAKNFLGSSAATDLGLGDQLVQQLQDTLDERKKKQQLMNDPINAAAGGGTTLGLIGGAGNLMTGSAVRALGLG